MKQPKTEIKEELTREAFFALLHRAIGKVAPKAAKTKESHSGYWIDATQTHQDTLEDVSDSPDDKSRQ